MQPFAGIGLVLFGAILIAVAVLEMGTCTGALILWSGVGVAAAGVGAVVIANGAWPVTVTLLVIGLCLVGFGYVLLPKGGCFGV